ncbi:MAG TPA: ATP-binding protein [Caulobacteraceae bacterium]
MLTSIHREALERFYRRVYGDNRAVRLASIACIAGLTAYTRVWPIAAAVAWAVAYAAGEFAMVAWWRSVAPRLADADLATVKRRQSELIAICAVACAICAVPGFFTPFAGRENQVVGLILSAAILLVAGAEHSLRRDMFVWTAPPAAAAMVWNAYALGQGPSTWVFVALAMCYVGNALALQQSNAKVFLELLRLRIDAEVANATKSEFLATVSHEIRTPLNGVLGMAQLMSRADLTPEQQSQVKVISDSGQSLLALLNSILDLAKIESGKIELEASVFDLGEAVQAAAATFAPLAEEKALEFVVEIAPALDGTWRGDCTRLRQVLINLVSNALKFTAHGAIRVSADSAPDGVVFSVADTGIGVPPDKLATIFEKFTQADSSTTRRFGGSGLGLAICERLVALMGGHMSVESTVGAGSTFTFGLPLTREAAPAAAAAPSERALADRQIKVLAAEDNATNQLILRALLETLDIDLTLVGDGQAAVEAFAADRYDAVLMDVQMPRMDGLAATAAIRRSERLSGHPRTPIVALTANVMAHQIEAYLAAGMDAHVAKPIELHALVSALDAALTREAETLAVSA